MYKKDVFTTDDVKLFQELKYNIEQLNLLFIDIKKQGIDCIVETKYKNECYEIGLLKFVRCFDFVKEDGKTQSLTENSAHVKGTGGIQPHGFITYNEREGIE